MGFNNGYESGYDDCEAENRRKWESKAAQEVSVHKVDKSAFHAFDNVNIGAGATQNEIINTLRTIVSKLRGLTACVVVVAAALTSHADEAALWGDMVPTNSMKDIVGQFAHPYTGQSYPLFVLDLNPDDTNKWFHIELKATTNNFATSEGMTFFCGTSVNGNDAYDEYPGMPRHDWCRLYAMGKRLDSDVRRWIAISDTQFMAVENYPPASLLVIVDPSMMRRGQGNDWLREDNDELTWSYVRIGHDPAETDAGDRQRWRAVMPVRWYKTLPEWANQTPVGTLQN